MPQQISLNYLLQICHFFLQTMTIFKWFATGDVKPYHLAQEQYYYMQLPTKIGLCISLVQCIIHSIHDTVLKIHILLAIDFAHIFA